MQGLSVDITFSMKNLQLLQKIIHDQILLKIWCVHLKSRGEGLGLLIDIMDEFDAKKLDIIKDIFATINLNKMI